MRKFFNALKGMASAEGVATIVVVFAALAIIALLTGHTPDSAAGSLKAKFSK